MSGDFMQRWRAISASLDRIAASRLFFPLATLVLGALTYLYALPSLGYFWDDWEVVFLLNSGDAQLFTSYFAFDRPFAWPYQVMYALFGLNPVAWHVATYLFRWGGVLLLYYSMVQVWPRHRAYLNWAGVLLLVYPGFLQQSISGAYNRHFAAFLVFALSVYLMVMSTRQTRWAALFAVASWVMAFIHVFTIEYYVGLELTRPALLWLLIHRRGQVDRTRSLARAGFLTLPYLLILAFYLWWRLLVFPSTIPVANYAGDFKFLQDFDASPLTGMLAVATRVFLDLIHATLRVWLSFLMEPDAWTLQGKISWLALGLGALLALSFWRLNQTPDGTQQSDARPPVSMLWFGLWAFLVGGVPIWLTSKQLSALGRWDDRFALAPMIPACLLLVWLIAVVVRRRWQGVLLAVILGLSISTQVLVVNRYRLEWAAQNQYYWQLHWRVPALEPGTAIISFEQPSASVPGYDASFALNVLFAGDVDGGLVPYWFFTNDRFLNFDLRPEKAISYRDRNLHFKGNTSAAIALIHQGENRCLQVLDAVYAGQPFYGVNQELLVAISNTSRISSHAAAPPNTDVFGREPLRSWCYYFQKADLARQSGDWNAVLDLEREATGLGFTSRFGPELLPFIEARARTGDWQGALDLSRRAEATVAEMDPLLCATWERLSLVGTPDAPSIRAARAEFACQIE